MELSLLPTIAPLPFICCSTSSFLLWTPAVGVMIIITGFKQLFLGSAGFKERFLTVILSGSKEFAPIAGCFVDPHKNRHSQKPPLSVVNYYFNARKTIVSDKFLPLVGNYGCCNQGLLRTTYCHKLVEQNFALARYNVKRVKEQRIPILRKSCRKHCFLLFINKVSCVEFYNFG
ncbi:hypothetical protein Gasu2_53380 [Galdieria sulphuraria]|nr:hypothetical protein Gasu2_53380 [Galdieria sulphuraria]